MLRRPELFEPVEEAFDEGAPYGSAPELNARFRLGECPLGRFGAAFCRVTASSTDILKRRSPPPKSALSLIASLGILALNLTAGQHRDYLRLKRVALWRLCTKQNFPIVLADCP